MHRLTERDIEVLVDVYTYRYLTLPQITALHFPSIKTAYRRLQALVGGKFLKTFTVPSIMGRIFLLDSHGAEFVAAALQVEVNDLFWHRRQKTPKDYYFLRHFLAINDFRIALTHACHNSPISLVGFIPEYIGEKTSKGEVKKYLRDKVCHITSPARYISHTPDAAFALEKDGNKALFFLEIDRGTEIVSDPEKGFLKAIVFYLNYWMSKQFKKYEQDFGNAEFTLFRALFVTTSPRRLQDMREAVTNYDFPRKRAKQLIWGATDVTRDNIFSPIWKAMDTTDDTIYTIG
jgi:hypothetical protein